MTVEQESLAYRAARAVIEKLQETEPEVEIDDGENPLSALGWIMGAEISYEQALEQVVAEAIKLHDAEKAS